MDRPTQKIVAYHGHLNMMEQETAIWMDGRPHPPANALHTWSGFSTGEWDGDVLVVTTTHLKEAYMRRTGVMRSDQATVRTRWRRMGNYLQATSILYDPVHMTGAVRPKHDDVGLRPRVWPRPPIRARKPPRPRYRAATRRTFCRARARCPA